jgi:hypothetical protein
MPGGMSQVLSLLTNVIKSPSTLIQTIVKAEAQALTQALI